MTSSTASRAGWTLGVAGTALFMTALDQLVVGVALHSIRIDLGGSIAELGWTVNAYTLAFAVLLITGATLGGPFVGGAVVEGIAWQWIFWANVPIGVALMPLAGRLLHESYGPDRERDLRGLMLASAGLSALTFGLIRGEGLGWVAGPTTTPARATRAGYYRW